MRQGGSYTVDKKTGERKRVEWTKPADQDALRQRRAARLAARAEAAKAPPAKPKKKGS